MNQGGHRPSAPHVVIVGGGFGGLYAARALGKRGPDVRVTLIDRQNHHLFQPLLYQVATAALSPGEIAEPIRHVLRRFPNVRVLLGEVQSVDVTERRLRLDESAVAYDFLVLAAGARHSYFGKPWWEPLAPGLKTLEDALEIRRRILSAFEAAEASDDPREQAALLTFVIIGGGPTGVELAGAIAEIARHTVARDFRRIDPTRARIILLEGGPRIMAALAPGQSASAERQLRSMGVEVRVGALVTDLTPEYVRVGDEAILTRTALWAAGVEASPLARGLGVPLTRAGAVVVEPDLTVPGHPEVYVVGDLAAFTHDAPDARPLPGLAPVAIQEGEWAAENVWRSIQNLPRERFRYVNRGSMATIGRARGVAEIGPLRFSGLPAWLAWLFVHIFFLIGFENRVLVLLQWAWSYFTYERGARLITRAWPATLPRPPAPASTGARASVTREPYTPPGA